MSETFATALDSLGEILPGDAGRDAIHLATYAVTSDETLFPGQHVGLAEGKASAKAGRLIGIVDPFLPAAVYPGQIFWLVLYPRSITSLRHIWTHPDFSDEARLTPAGSNKSASEAWLRTFVQTSDCPAYEEVLARAVSNGESSDPSYLHFDGYDAHGEIPEEFWTHVEVVTGRKIPETQRATYFSCSC